MTAAPEKLSSFRWVAGIGFPVSEMHSFEDMIAALPEPAALCQFGAILLRARMDSTACQRLAKAAAAGSAEACWYLSCYRYMAAVSRVETKVADRADQSEVAEEAMRWAVVAKQQGHADAAALLSTFKHARETEEDWDGGRVLFLVGRGEYLYCLQRKRTVR